MMITIKENGFILENVKFKDTAFNKVTLGGLAITFTTTEFELQMYGINDQDDFIGFSVKEKGADSFERDIDLLDSDYNKYLSIAKIFVKHFNLVAVYRKHDRKF